MCPEPEFAEEYTLIERVRFIVIGTLAGLLLIFSSKTWLFPWISEFASSAACRKVLGLDGLVVLWYGLFVGLPLHATILVMVTLGWRGYKILRDNQVPPAKEKVFKPTRIRRGPEARRIGYIHLSAFLPFLILTIWGSFQASEMSRITRPKAGICVANQAGTSSDGKK